MSNTIQLPGEVAPNPTARLVGADGAQPRENADLFVPGGAKIGRDRRFYVGEKGKDPVSDWNKIQSGASHEVKAEELEFAIAKQIGTFLCNRYKNREWGVNVDLRNMIVVIGQPSLSKHMGYHLHFKPGETMPQLLDRCYRAAGEILERFNVSRRQDTDPAEIEVGAPRDFRDNVISVDAQPD